MFLSIQEETILNQSKFNDLNIEIYGTHENPLFKASDIAAILEIKNIRTSLNGLIDGKDKGVRTTYTLGGEQQTIFLTESGLYKLLMKSRKPIAEKFQDWVCEIIKNIRLKGKYEIETQSQLQIEAGKQEIVKKAKEDRERLLIEKFDNRPVFYLADIGENLIKYGYSDNIKQRVAAHKRVFPSFYLHDLIETTSNRELERRFESHDYISSRRIKQEFAGANQTELIGDSSLEKIYEIALKLRENLSGENDRFRHEEAMKDKEIELKRIELEMAKLKISPITTHENKPLSSHTVKELKEICYKHGIIPPKKKTDIIIELYKILSPYPQQLDHIFDIDYLPQPKATKENLENEKGKKIDDETEELYGFLDTIIEYKKGEKLNRSLLMEKIQEKYLGRYNDNNSQGKFYNDIFPSYLNLRYSNKNIDFDAKFLRNKDSKFKRLIFISPERYKYFIISSSFKYPILC